MAGERLVIAASLANQNAERLPPKQKIKISQDSSAAILIPATLLYEAARDGRIEEVQRLLNNGVSIESNSLYKAPPLHIAADNGHDAIIDCLLEHAQTLGNSDYINSLDRFGRTALHKATLAGHLEIVNKLIAAGANVNAADLGNNTVLHCAVRSGDIGVVKALVTAGADIVVADDQQWTPLHTAIMYPKNNIEDMCNYLLAARLDPQSKARIKVHESYLERCAYAQLSVIGSAIFKNQPEIALLLASHIEIGQALIAEAIATLEPYQLSFMAALREKLENAFALRRSVAGY